MSTKARSMRIEFDQRVNIRIQNQSEIIFFFQCIF